MLAFVLVVAGTAVLVPAIDDARQRREALERREREQAHERRERTLAAEQRPRFGRVAIAGASPARPAAGPAVPAAARAAAVGEITGAIAADARRRVRRGALSGPIRRVECEPFPRGATLSGRRGRYACLAVTSVFEGGAIGHPYRAMIDFRTGRYAFCKVTGRPDPTPDPEVTTPRVCGG
jgi:hypothetical protein